MNERSYVCSSGCVCSLDDCIVIDYWLCIYFINYFFSCCSSRNVFSDIIKKIVMVK